MTFGIFVGSTPGLTATMAVALIIPFSFQLEKEAALAMVIGVSFTAIFAGDIPATFLRIPGTPASAAATLDAHKLALNGKGKQTLLINLLCSAMGGILGVLLLVLIAPQLAKFALNFGPFEYFWLCLTGLVLGVTVSSGRQQFLGILGAFLGFAFSLVGVDPLTNQSRFIFNIENLSQGLNFIPAMIGLFGMSEVLKTAVGHTTGSLKPPSPGPFRLKASLRIILRHFPTVLQSALTGTAIGALPGAGADIAAWGAYGVSEKTTLKAKPDFGDGNWKGVISPTSANNSAVAAAWIPALVFGVPGDAVTAIVLGAFLVYDITPGPGLFESGNADFIFSIAIVTQFLLLPAGLLGILLFSQIAKLPRGIILTAVVMFSVVGSYAMNNSITDVWVMFGFGIFGLILENQRVPLAPLILGMILGPKIEVYLRTGLISCQGEISNAFSSDISRTLVTLLVAILIYPLLRSLTRKVYRRYECVD
ncbi:MAG: tripartite tricarboxylate transporter permease [Pirellulales bacterium]|nr:tripartite tricarboxylate transporter permease [Pirellulales bacterium]